MKSTIWILLLVPAISSAAFLPGVSKGTNWIRGGWKSRFPPTGPERSEVDLKCTNFTSLEARFKAMEKCAADFGIQPATLLTLGPKEKEEKIEGSNGTDARHFETKLEEIDENFKQLVGNHSDKIPDGTYSRLHEFKVPGKIFQYSCFGACISKAMLFSGNNTIDNDQLKEKIKATSEDKISLEFAEKIIENCYNRTGLNSTGVIDLPQGTTVLDADNCRRVLRFSMCISKSSWEMCKYLEP